VIERAPIRLRAAENRVEESPLFLGEWELGGVGAREVSPLSRYAWWTRACIPANSHCPHGAISGIHVRLAVSAWAPGKSNRESIAKGWWRPCQL